jgi:hypothetical protein
VKYVSVTHDRDYDMLHKKKSIHHGSNILLSTKTQFVIFEEDVLGCRKFSCKGKPGSVAKEAKNKYIRNKKLFPRKQICIAGISVKLLFSFKTRFWLPKNLQRI